MPDWEGACTAGASGSEGKREEMEDLVKTCTDQKTRVATAGEILIIPTPRAGAARDAKLERIPQRQWGRAAAGLSQWFAVDGRCQDASAPQRGGRAAVWLFGSRPRLREVWCRPPRIVCFTSQASRLWPKSARGPGSQ